ncbi:MAG: hypothetical protein [Olavius algarvensis Delta 4 endosymbiont]|nr:MAG: hypothetical protein [Olavius algarvensis Delta 4 endosymbiont]
MTLRALLSLLVGASLLILSGCMAMPTPETHPTTAGSNLAHQYGEEVLAYLMQVVLGQAGDPDNRATWRSRGLDQDLDLERIAGIMSDPGGNKTAIMVNDPNILGLSKVLYHYAPEMSQFSGNYATSLYPATELVALRLFLLKRIQADRKVSLPALLNHQALLQDPEREATRAEMAAMNLTRDELRLLQSVFQSKPWLFDSLTSPFLVAAFSSSGILEKEPLTAKLISRASYPNAACRPMDTSSDRDALVIAFLPSMTREFSPGNSGFIPSDAYLAAVDSLRQGILAALGNIVQLEIKKVAMDPAESAGQRLQNLTARKISFRSLSTRPLVVHPGNADRVVQDTCPAADFAIILLGRNVYQSVHIDPAKDIYPATNRIYLDITDVKHAQVSSEVDDIGRFLYEKLKSR